MLSMSRSRLGPAGDPPPNLGVASKAEPPIIVFSAPLLGSTSQIARPLSSASQIEWSCGTSAPPSVSFTEIDEFTNGDVLIVRDSWSVGLAIAAPAETATHNTATSSAEPAMPGPHDRFLAFIVSLLAWIRPSFERRYPTPGSWD